MSGSIKKNLRCPTLFFFISKSFSCGDVVPVDHRGTSPCHHSPNPASGVEEGQFKAGTTFGVQVSNVRLLQESKKKGQWKGQGQREGGLTQCTVGDCSLNQSRTLTRTTSFMCVIYYCTNAKHHQPRQVSVDFFKQTLFFYYSY